VEVGVQNFDGIKHPSRGTCKRSIQFIIMRQCCDGFSTNSVEKRKYAILSDSLFDQFLDHLCAPFTLMVLLACATGSGSAFAQTVPSSVSLAPQSNTNTKTPGNDIPPVPVGGSSYLGVYLGDVTPERASELGVKEIRGAVVGRVEAGSPAEKVGLQENDVILSFNGKSVQNRAQFYQLLIELTPGTRVSLGISRRGANQELSVMLGQGRVGALSERQKLFSTVNAILGMANEVHGQGEELLRKGDEKGAQKVFEDEKALRQEAERIRLSVEDQLRKGKIEGRSSVNPSNYAVSTYRQQLGIKVIPLTPQLAMYFKSAKGGVLVTEVRAGELGERNGLKAGDCIRQVNGQTVSAAQELNRLVDQKSSGESEFVIIRDGVEQTIKFKLDQR
jgi:membrane-associated protease RseP (regulator of RpoE activity)